MEGARDIRKKSRSWEGCKRGSSWIPKVNHFFIILLSTSPASSLQNSDSDFLWKGFHLQREKSAQSSTISWVPFLDNPILNLCSVSQQPLVVTSHADIIFNFPIPCIPYVFSFQFFLYFPYILHLKSVQISVQIFFLITV